MAQYQPTNPQPFNFTQAQQNSSSPRSTNWNDDQSQWRNQEHQSPVHEAYVEDYDSDQDYQGEFGQQYGASQNRQNQGRNFSQRDRNFDQQYGQQNYQGQRNRNWGGYQGGQSGRDFSQQNQRYGQGRFGQEHYGQEQFGHEHFQENYGQGGYGQSRSFGNMPFEYDQPGRHSSNPYQPYQQPYSQQYSQGWPQGQYSAGREQNYQDHWQQGQGYYQGQRNPSQRGGYSQGLHSQGTQQGQQYGWGGGRSQTSQYPDIGWDNSFMGGASSQRNDYGTGMQGSTQQNWRGRSPKGYSRSDERIKEDICERLSQDPHIDASEITVEVKSGVVTLEGTITDRNQKHRIEDLADACSGVKDVTNRLSVSRQGQSQSNQSGSPQFGSASATHQGSENEHKTSTSKKQ